MPGYFNPSTDKFYQMGKKNEVQYLPIFREKIDPTLEIIGDMYSVIDYQGTSCWVELKSRTCSFNAYSETFFGANKIPTGFDKLASGLRVFFAFGFTDGLYIWELTNSSYEEVGGDGCIKMGGTNNRGYADYKKHFYLDTKFLTKISTQGSELGSNTSKKVSTSLTGKCFIKL